MAVISKRAVNSLLGLFGWGVVALLGACSTSSVTVRSADPDSQPANAATGAPAAGAPSSAKPAGPPSWTKSKGGYYMDDGPLDFSGLNLDAIPDATPFVEPLHRFANRPYNVFGVDYTPQIDLDLPFSQTGVGSWYGRKFHGQRTSSGEIYDMFAMTAAHPTLPIPSYVRVSSLKNGRSVVVRVNDRGPFLHSRVIDLSFAAAYRLGYTKEGSSELKVEKLTPRQIAQLGNKGIAAPALATSDSPPVQASLNTVPAITGFFLQVGAFSVEDNAKAFLSRLSLEFGEDLPNLKIVRKEPVFKLLAGPYRSRDDAHTASQRLKQAAELAAIVIQQ